MGFFKKKINAKNSNPYLGLREQALQMLPKDIGIALDNNEQVYCAVVDMPVDAGFATLVCVFDGTVSLYYSNGGGLLGLGQKHEEVRNAGNSFLLSIGQTLSSFPITDNFDLPTSQEASVYLLAGDGIHKVEYDMSKIENYKKEIQFLNFLIQNTLNKTLENS